MIAPNYFISIDIGGTTACGIAVSWPDGSPVRLQAPSKNLRLMVDLELGQLLFTLANLLPDSTFKKSGTWLIGAAGARPESDRPRIALLLRDIGISASAVEVFPDYEGNLAAAFCGEDGLISVNGTGSVIYGRSGPRATRRGGWGYLLDETPSGALFGQWALQQLLGEWESPQAPQFFSGLYAAAFPDLPKTREGIVGLLYSSSSPQKFLGRFSTLFASALKEGHMGSHQAFKTALTHWQRQLEETALDLDMTPPIRFCGVGGLWRRWTEFPTLVREHLKSDPKNEFTLEQPRFPNEWGPLIRHFLTLPESDDSWKTILKRLAEPS